MVDKSGNTKRIAKNTMMLYIRMLFGMLVSLYTSRVVLQTLGVEDYGISNVVGGVVAMMSFLNDSMSGATSRFITFELGKGNKERLNDTFSSAMIIHLCIAALVMLVAETVGLWFLETQLVIPDNRMLAARIVYQCSIISMILGITQVPYNASIISHEKMDVYAYVGILNICLRLLIVYLLVIGDFDKLILYSFLQLSVSLLIITIYRVYCVRNFFETKFKFIWKTDILKPMLHFSSWDLYGNASVMARTQGVSMLLNVFFGPVLNASAGIAAQVQGAVMGLASNLVTAVRPQIVKQYAVGEYSSMIDLLRNSVKLSFLLICIISLPLICELNFVLTLWLGIVPNYVIQFCRYTLLFNIFANMSMILASAIHATGKIKRISIINGSLYLLVIPFSYVAYKLHASPSIAFLFNCIAVMIGTLSNAWTIHLYIKEFSFTQFFYKDFLKMVFVLVTVFLCLEYTKSLFIEGWIRLLISICISSLLILSLGYFILLTPQYRIKILNIISNKIRLWN